MQLKSRKYQKSIFLFTTLFGLMVTSLIRAEYRTVERISISTTGIEGDQYSEVSDISADGRYVVFYSNATTLVANDTNEDADIFVRDHETNTTTRVSVASNGTQADCPGISESCNYTPYITASGRYVIFSSAATNLVTDDTNGQDDTFVHDLQTGETFLYGNGIEDPETFTDAVSPDERYVAFISDASDLVPNDTNNNPDVFFRDRETGVTIRVSVTIAGDQISCPLVTECRYRTPNVSSDGRYVVFGSNSNDLVISDTQDPFYGVYSYDVLRGANALISLNEDGNSIGDDVYLTGVNANARIVVFMSQNNTIVPGETGLNDYDIFARDVVTGQVFRVSVASDGAEAICDEDLEGACSSGGDISADGRFITFFSFAENLVGNDNNGFQDIFLHDLATGQTELVSLNNTGNLANSGSFSPVISSDGQIISFSSAASNLAGSDTNEVADIYVAESGATELLVNGDFEVDANTDKQPDSWIGKGLQGDKLKCNSAEKFTARSGVCAYQFKGALNTSAKLQQDIDLSNLVLNSGDTLTLAGFASTGSGPMSFKVKLRVNYTDDSTGKLNLTAPIVSGGYVGITGSSNQLTLTDGNIDRIRVQIQDKSQGGKIFVDGMSLMLTPTNASLLPLPLP